MAETVSKDRETLYSTELFLYAVCPLLKTILEDRPALQTAWQKKRTVAQISCLEQDGKKAIHYIFENGACTPKKGVSEEPIDIELEFKSPEHLCSFFKGKLLPLPKMKGALKHFSAFLNFMKLLLVMSGLLGAKTAPKKIEDQKLLVKCMFYLLSRGISLLNKLGHPAAAAWAAASPDRVYAWEVEGEPELSAWLRVCKGHTKARRGLYTKSIPFFTMKFDSPKSALGILQETDDMIEATIQQRLIMVGGPEFGAQLGDLMLTVGGLVK